jgi:alkanesulfonate monooxygenase SsuD/methylene tetrahydromethanopterin reductase-like flavin-dependent oxidoreductase (luciferase family)
VRGNGALLAKQLATIDNLSEGRLTVGVAVGGRADDYAATGVPFEERGRIFDEQLVEFQRVWSGAARGGGVSPIGPSPVQPGGPPLLVGGTSDAAMRRAVTSGVGWISGGGGPAVFAVGAERVRAAWRGSGRVGRPRLVALGYFALGPGAVAAAGSYLGDYYQFLGESAALIVRGALTTPDVVRVAVTAFADAGCDELILFPCSSELDQLDRLAEVTLDH